MPLEKWLPDASPGVSICGRTSAVLNVEYDGLNGRPNPSRTCSEPAREMVYVVFGLSSDSSKRISADGRVSVSGIAAPVALCRRLMSGTSAERGVAG